MSRQAEPWTGRTASALQTALRLSTELFAERLGIGARTVAAWRANPTLKPKWEAQQLLDTVYERATEQERERFAELVSRGQERPAGASREGVTDAALVQAEQRLGSDTNIAAALEWLDEQAGWRAGTSRARVAAELAAIDVSRLRDRAVERARVSQRDLRRVLADYYGQGSPGSGTYAASFGDDASIATTILTRPEWLDIACPLRSPSDRLSLGRSARTAPGRLDEAGSAAAVRRLAESLELGTRFVDMPLYQLRDVDIGDNAINGRLGVTRFSHYALTMDLLEGELLDATASSEADVDIRLPLRDRYLPDLSTVTGIGDRLCAGGVLALCAIARPQGLYGEPDYLVLVQQRSGNVLNANRQLTVIPKGFHQPIADNREDAAVGATLFREIEEELFGREDVDSTQDGGVAADPMHSSRLSDPMAWLLQEPSGRRLRLECTGFGFNLISGNFEFASLVVIEDYEFWTLFGGRIEANWESSNLQRYSTRDPERIAELLEDPAWNNEGVFAFMQGLRRLAEIGGERVKLPAVEWEV